MIFSMSTHRAEMSSEIITRGPISFVVEASLTGRHDCRSFVSILSDNRKCISMLLEGVLGLDSTRLD